MCAGQGHDLLGAPAGRGRVRVRLIEYVASNVAATRAAVERAELSGIEVAGAVPADLVLPAGVPGDISDADVERTIGALPRFCATGATVIWTRVRRPPDPVPRYRDAPHFRFRA